MNPEARSRRAYTWPSVGDRPGRAPRLRFVGGKGGVGKTTLAASWALAAVARAPAGERVLVLSTDPAHSLGDALGETLTAEPRPVAGAPGLLAAELAAGPAWRRWLAERRDDLVRLAERGTYLDPAHAERLLDLPVPGVDELVGLAEVSRLARSAGAAEVVVDTAPTAHTLRLLAQPETLGRFGAFLEALAEKHRVVAERLVGASAEDSASRAAHAVVSEAAGLAELLRDPERTTFAWVLLAEELSLEETGDALEALEAAGVSVDLLLVNRLVPPPETPCRRCEAERATQAGVLGRLTELGRGLAVRQVSERAEEPVGPAALERLAGWVTGERAPVAEPAGDDDQAVAAWPVRSGPAAAGESDRLLDRLAPRGLSLLFVGGKGGVGKSTVAAALALLLARQRPGLRVLLLSTDPAHSLADVLETDLSDDPRPVPLPEDAAGSLVARELSAETAYGGRRQRLREHLAGFLRTGDRAGGAELGLDRAVLERLLEAVPPGLDELEAVAALADAVTAGEPDTPDLVVVDTAPTGHTVQLLELPEVALAWVHTLMSLLLDYREALGLGALAEELLALSRQLKRLRDLLRDPSRTRFLPVTRAAGLPRRETVRLLAALDRLGVAAPIVLVNATTAAAGAGECPRCRRLRQGERAEIARFGADRAILEAPAAFPPPRGVDVLLDWAESFTFGGTEP